MAIKQSLVPVERIERAILLIRGQKVMLDADLAALYGVDPHSVRGGKTEHRQFPVDFLFQLTKGEFSALRSQMPAPHKDPARKLSARCGVRRSQRRRKGGRNGYDGIGRLCPDYHCTDC